MWTRRRKKDESCIVNLLYEKRLDHHHINVNIRVYTLQHIDLRIYQWKCQQDVVYMCVHQQCCFNSENWIKFYHHLFVICKFMKFRKAHVFSLNFSTSARVQKSTISLLLEIRYIEATLSLFILRQALYQFTEASLTIRVFFQKILWLKWIWAQTFQTLGEDFEPLKIIKGRHDN